MSTVLFWRATTLGIASWFLAQVDGWGQPSIGYFGPKKEVVTLDPLSNIPDTNLPYDRYFYIKRYFDKDAPVPDHVFINNFRNAKKYYETITTSSPPTSLNQQFWQVKSDITDSYPDKPNAISILIEPLDPQKSYDLVFTYRPSLERRKLFTEAFLRLHAAQQAKVAGDQLEEATKRAEAVAILALVNTQKRAAKDFKEIRQDDFEAYYQQHIATLIPSSTYNQELRNNLTEFTASHHSTLVNIGGTVIPTDVLLDMETLALSGTEAFKLETRTGSRVQPDLGVITYGLGSGRADELVSKNFWGVSPYVGVNFLVRPFDADIPMRYLRNRVTWPQRLSAHVGLTLSSLSKESYRENLIADKYNLMTGVGYRLTSALKVQGGLIWYKKKDPNPLYSETSTARTGYVGISLDFRIRNVLGDIGTFLFGIK